MDFLNEYNNSQYSQALGIFNTLTERTDENQRDLLVKTATNAGTITLLTREMGRGVDFICRDKDVLKNGGVLVVQTFFSDEKSEQIQIMGRCARQGQQGAYCLFLHINSITKFLSEKEISNFVSSEQLYDALCKTREIQFNKNFASLEERVKQMKEPHDQSVQFVKCLIQNDIKSVREFMRNFNLGQAEQVFSRTLCLIDGTESMGEVMEQLKNNLHQIFRKTSSVLVDRNLPAGAFQIQLAFYRDYDMGIEEVLQVSGWKDEPNDLIEFLQKVDPVGGDDWEEAVEIGLWYANQEHIKDNITQVILIADAGSKNIEAVIRDRKKYGGEDVWARSQFGKATDWEEQTKILKENGVPCHTIYLENDDNWLIKNFQMISQRTVGKSQYISVKQPALANYLPQ